MNIILVATFSLCSFAFADSATFMTDGQTKQLYGETGVESTPAGTQISFKNWIIPANSLCSNTKKMGGSSCTVCGSGKISRETRQLGTYQMNDVGDSQPNVSNPGDSVALPFSGVGDNFVLNCEMHGGAGNIPQFANKLKSFGIEMKFKKPQTATIQAPSNQPDASSPADAAG